MFEPMPSGDGLLVRVKPPGARLTAGAARRLAGAAARFGNGAIELTSRGAVQVRGLQAPGVPAFAAAMVSAGLADADPAVERRRAVIASPLAGDDPGASPDAAILAAAIENMLARDPRFAGLPPKFCVSVDGGGVLPLGDVDADIRVVCGTARHADHVERVVRVALAFLELSAHCSPAPRRMRAFLGEVGVPRLLVAAGLDMPVRSSPQSAIGWIPYADGERGAFGLGLPFGTTNPASLACLVDLADQFGDGMLRITPWRAILIPSVSGQDAIRLREAGAAMGMIVDATDPRLKISACVGRPGCAGASVNARADAMRVLSPDLHATVHVSGCAKGCAHPATAAYTLVGEEGRYGLVRNGGTGDAPLHRCLTIEQAAALICGERP